MQKSTALVILNDFLGLSRGMMSMRLGRGFDGVLSVTEYRKRRSQGSHYLGDVHFSTDYAVVASNPM